MELIPFPPPSVQTGALPKAPRRQAEIRFVILADCFDDQGNTKSAFTCATRHLKFARRVFNEQASGITFPRATTAGLFTDLIGTPGADDLTVDCNDASNLSALRTISPTSTSTVTVYYIGDTSGPTAWTCPNAEMIIMSGAPSPDTLAHEFGHALSLTLSHYNPFDSGVFDNRNLMIGADVRGEMLTLGQSFRFNLDDRSILKLGATTASAEAMRRQHYRPLSSDTARSQRLR